MTPSPPRRKSQRPNPATLTPRPPQVGGRAAADRASRASAVAGVFLYMLRDTGTVTTEKEQSFGILKHDGTRKASYRTVRYALWSLRGDLPEDLTN